MLWFVSRLTLCALTIGLAIGWVWLGASRSRRRRAEEIAAAHALTDQREQLLGLLIDALAPKAAPVAELDSVPPLLARDATTGTLLAIVAFRSAVDAGNAPLSAIFVWRRGRWETDGRLFPGATPEATCAAHPRQLVALAWPDEQ